MYREKDFTKPFYRAGEVAKYAGVTVKTIQNYDKRGTLVFSRNQYGRRILMREDLLDFLDRKGLLFRDSDDSRHDVIYARVSSHEQKAKGDLDRQAMYIVEHAKELKNPVVLKEVGSGLNDARPLLQRLIRMVMSGEVRYIYVTYKDRLTRFGYRYLETVAEANNTEIIVLKDERKDKDVQEELVDDMMSLIASFSGKLYGLRSGRNRGGNTNG